MRGIIAIVVAIVMALIASRKGFSWWLWVLAGGIPGFIILLCMPSVSTVGINEETRIRRRKNGNTVGGIISVIAIIIIVGFIAWISSL